MPPKVPPRIKLKTGEQFVKDLKEKMEIANEYAPSRKEVISPSVREAEKQRIYDYLNRAGIKEDSSTLDKILKGVDTYSGAGPLRNLIYKLQTGEDKEDVSGEDIVREGFVNPLNLDKSGAIAKYGGIAAEMILDPTNLIPGGQFKTLAKLNKAEKVLGAEKAAEVLKKARTIPLDETEKNIQAIKAVSDFKKNPDAYPLITKGGMEKDVYSAGNKVIKQAKDLYEPAFQQQVAHGELAKLGLDPDTRSIMTSKGVYQLQDRLTPLNKVDIGKAQKQRVERDIDALIGEKTPLLPEDIRAANIGLNEAKAPKVLDIGATEMLGEPTEQAVDMATKRFMALPETKKAEIAGFNQKQRLQARKKAGEELDEEALNYYRNKYGLK